MEAAAKVFNRSDPRQPSEARCNEAAEAPIAAFDGDLGGARSWAIGEAIRFEAAGDRKRDMTARSAVVGHHVAGARRPLWP